METSKPSATPATTMLSPTISDIHLSPRAPAKLTRVAAGAKGAAILAQLQLQPLPSSVILVLGGAHEVDAMLKPRLTQLISRGVARMAVEIGADILGNGVDTGIMAILGEGVAERGKKSRLIGVAPLGCVQYPGQTERPNAANALPLEPNHTHFALVEGEDWHISTEVLLDVAQAMVQQYKIPIITLLIRGDAQDRTAMLRAVRNNWPMIVVTGSGQLADEISQLAENPPEFIEDAALAEILGEGDIHLFPANGSVTELNRLIQRRLRGDSTLKLAWDRFALYDANANRQQHGFRRLQMSILALGVIGTLLALIQGSIENMLMLTVPADSTLLDQAIEMSIVPQFMMHYFYYELVRPNTALFTVIKDMLKYVIILVPIIATILLAAANRFNAGTKWLLLRGSAEAIKREIFRYRAGAEIYGQSQTATITPEVKLAEKLQEISRQLMQTEVNLSALRPYTGKLPPLYSTADKDDGLGNLTPDQYLMFRVEEQYRYYSKKTNMLEKKLHKLQWVVYIIGGVGTLLAALGLELWIALTGALVAAVTTYLEYQQIENALLKYNQAASELDNIRCWWLALSAKEQERQENIDVLVRQTERTLQSEFSGWMQDMQDALSMMKEHQEQAESQAKDGKQNFLVSEVLSNRITRYTGNSAAVEAVEAYQHGRNESVPSSLQSQPLAPPA